MLTSHIIRRLRLDHAPRIARALSIGANSSPVEDFDIVIVGGGVAGSAFAAAIQSTPLTAGLRCAVIDQAPLPTSEYLDAPPEIPDARVSTLTPVSIALLRAAGAWERISASRAGSFSSMQVWDGVSGAHVRYSAAEAGGAQELGCVVENRTIHAALAERLAAFEAVSVLAPDGVASIRFAGPAGAPAEVATTSGRRLTCRLVVAADGARSPTRAAAGIDTVGWSYDQSAVVGTVETDSPHSTAWQRFLPSGPIALLPVTDRFSNIVWTTTAAHAAALAKGSDEAFAAEVDAALQGTGAFSAHSMSGEFGSATAQAAAAAVGQIQRALTTAAWAAGAPPPDPDRPPRVTAAAGRRGSFPLALRHARTYFGPRLALVGDAAHAIHPLAGQGLNLGLSDAGVLAKVLAEASRIGADIGTAPVLAKYERGCTVANLPMIAAVDGAPNNRAAALQRLFCNDSPLLSAIRSAGLTGVNSVGPLRKAIAMYAMGHTGGRAAGAGGPDAKALEWLAARGVLGEGSSIAKQPDDGITSV